MDCQEAQERAMEARKLNGMLAQLRKAISARNGVMDGLSAGKAEASS
jgi:hypothetical protein